MTTPIIGGGSSARAAITQMETASLSWNQQERDDGEAWLEAIASCMKARSEDNTPLPELVAP